MSYSFPSKNAINGNSLSPVLHLTGLRGLAAMMVLAAHLFGALPRDYVLLTDFSLALAYSGISIFFVLSGFVITYNYADHFEKTRSFGRATYEFIVTRFARLYPLYLFIILIAEWQRCHSFICVSSYFAMLQSWFGFQSHVPSIELTWSISTEWFFYLGFIFFVPVLNQISKISTAWILFVLCILAAIGTQLIAYQNVHTLTNLMAQLNWGGFELDNSNNIRWLSYFSPYVRFFDFAFGALAAKLIILERNHSNLEEVFFGGEECSGFD